MTTGLPSRRPIAPQEVAQDVHPVLALKLAEVDVKVDLVGGHRTEDRQHVRDRPDPQINGVRINGT